MNVDVAKALKELLYSNEAVILPGLGGFTSSPVAAVVDYVQGSVQPPAKKLEFNTNLVINDGILVNHIQKSEVITAQEANVAIDNYVAGIQESLEQREIVDIPEVGRLYKDYEQKIRFMPDNTNFEIGSYGLPSVKFNPIVRQKNTGAASTATATQTSRPKSTARVQPIAVNESSWAERALPWLIGVAAILLAFSLFMWLNDSGNEQQANVPQERVNVKPTQDESEINDGGEQAGGTNENTASSNESTSGNSGSGDEPLTNSSPSSTTGKSSKSTTAPAGPDGEPSRIDESSGQKIFVVIHSFGNAENARNFARQLERAGYTATTKKQGGLNRVGVEVPAAMRNEVDGLIKELGRKFKSTPVVVDY